MRRPTERPHSSVPKAAEVGPRLQNDAQLLAYAQLTERLITPDKLQLPEFWQTEVHSLQTKLWQLPGYTLWKQNRPDEVQLTGAIQKHLLNR